MSEKEGTMRNPTDRVRITIELTTEEAEALAQMCKRFSIDVAERLADRHDSGKERDHIRDAISILRRGLGEQGFDPR
jgi:DNA-binding MarR family transcriptional regulator